VRFFALCAILTFALGLLVAPLVADAQPPTKAHRIGVLYFGSPEPEGTSTPLGLHGEALLQGLRELGYVEGQNITIEWRFAERRERLADLTAELVQLPVDALVTVGTPATRAAKQASTTIPII
jgi:putative ABC transport system substrate-binding protein